ncbi:hypothetical protein BC826DRAFT_1184243 [Russula brevipes]|nr:hypothetical protein BC826DRAFT_1184243 [Russula brevipes]
MSSHRTAGNISACRNRQAGTLVMTERWWRDRYHEIAKNGYQLRPRYHPHRRPSWFKSGKDFCTVEDGQPTILRATMDATRVRDNLQVILKRALPADGPHELIINQQFSSPELAAMPHNHCAPLLDVVELQHAGSQKLMVFPLLRPFNQPKMQTFGEFVDFFTQICEGLQFMHERNVAHRDCTANNIMFDAPRMYPNGFHPVKIDRNRNSPGTAETYTRTQCPPIYYFIDFDKSAPEHRSQTRCNPFQTDIYYIGNLVRQEFVEKYHDFGFMEGLINSMTLEDPARRPSIEHVIQKFTEIRASLSKGKLRSPIIPRRLPKLLWVIQ